MATLKFILRKSNRGSEVTGKICARLIHSRQVRVLTLPISLYPKEWNEETQKIILDEADTPRYSYLSKAVDQLTICREEFDATVERLEKCGRYQVSDIILSTQKRQGLSGLQGFTVYLSRNLQRTGQERTARAYMTACRVLIHFNKGCDVALKHLNSCLIKEFENWLRGRGRSMNTISYYMRMLRAIYRKAIRERLIDAKRDNPFEGVFTGFEETRKRALDVEQLRELYQLDFSSLLEQQGTKEETGAENETPTDKGLYDCWRYFFFCFHARGMSFVDMAYLRKDNIRHGVISYYRKKTGKKLEITLTPILKRIIDSFEKEVKYSPFVFPIINNPNKPQRLQYETGLKTQNKRLKRLAKLANIELDWGLSTHVSRHSWATMGKKQNLPLSVISEGLGHHSEKMTYTYLASFDRSTLDRASEQIDRLLIGPLTSPDYYYIPT